MAIKQGNIPEHLKFFVRPQEGVSFRWDDVESGQIDFKVSPCYISDAKNEGTCKTGEDWAKGNRWQEEDLKFTTFETPNTPFSNLRIITLEIRAQGGRAYKVAADIAGHKNLYFDCREDVLLDCMFQEGVLKGGIIPGKFIFAKIASQMKVIRVGSTLHQEMIKATEYGKKEPIKNLEVGGLYEKKNGDRGVYLGQFWVRKPKIVWRNYTYSDHRTAIDKISFSKPSLIHVFHDSYLLKYADENPWFHEETNSSYGKIKGEPTAYKFLMVKNHAFREKVGQLEIPPNYIDIVKESLIKTYTEPKYLESFPIDRNGGMLSAISELLSISADKDYIHPLLSQYIK